MAITDADVEELDKTSWQQLDSSKKTELREIAERMIDNQFSAQVARLPTLIGDEDDATKFLAAHLWTLAEGGETGSESATGGNVTYNTVTGDIMTSLTLTRYGQTFRSEYLRDEQGIGIVVTK